MAKYKVIYTVDRIKSKCPVLKVGDRVVLEDSRINLKESTGVCLLALQNYPFWLMHARGSDSVSNYVGEIQGENAFACPYPGEPYTEYGGVIFTKQERRRLEKDEVEERKYQSCKVTVYVHEIFGYCPMVSLGDKLDFESMLYLDESKISREKLFEKRTVLCPWIIAGLLPFILAMWNGVSAAELGLTKRGEDGYAQCAAWGPPECHANVVFRLHPEPIQMGFVDRFYTHCAKLGWLAIPPYYLKYATPAQKEAWKENWQKVAESLKLKAGGK